MVVDVMVELILVYTLKRDDSLSHHHRAFKPFVPAVLPAQLLTRESKYPKIACVVATFKLQDGTYMS